MNLLAGLQRPFVAYGYRDRVSGQFRQRTRISSSATFIDRRSIAIADNVWIGHYCHVDGSAGVTIGEGVQMATWSGILSHGSQDAIRLCGHRFIEIEAANRPGYTLGPVQIGAFAFIGAGAIVLPGVTIGRGARIDAGAIVTRDVPDFAIARGIPARIVGDVREGDALHFDDSRVRDSYFDAQVIEDWSARLRDGAFRA
jgi:acetyltransferase-like isoleucine patch superfamily enzyme